MNIVPIMLIVKGLVKKKKRERENWIYTYFRREAAGVNFYNTVSFLSSKGQKLLLNSGNLKLGCFFFPHKYSANNSILNK